MMSLLSTKIQEWNTSDLCQVIVGSGEGRAVCAGGDVASVVKNASNPDTRPKAVDFFTKEFTLDYLLAGLNKPYIAIMDGITLGGGVGLCAPAPFRIATEKTMFGMPETKIGYCPDVGASYYLSRLDGGLGTYLALTGNSLKGRAVYEHGFATHYVSSDRIPKLLEALAAYEKPELVEEEDMDSLEDVNDIINEFATEREPSEPPAPFIGDLRRALDHAFSFSSVQQICAALQKLSSHKNNTIGKWAQETLDTLHLRSPTSLVVALKAMQLGRKMDLGEALNMELKIAYEYCNGTSRDFITGVNAVLINKTVKDSGRPDWAPTNIESVSRELVAEFFPSKAKGKEDKCPYLDFRELQASSSDPYRFALPSEQEIEEVVTGTGEESGHMGLTFDDLLEMFEYEYPGKMGLKERLEEVVARKCEVVDNGDGNFVWLQWIHKDEI